MRTQKNKTFHGSAMIQLDQIAKKNFIEETELADR